ncbi:uncharacterized protein LOC114534621 [Dendronephthya gigantea]|uniref:uncharacterized protein LOC114534621 n=1 Tax=Dendronephthya gigantea TaxID=151771 RepID=UPI00106962FC|nr:uncharacterized protein LOC114534621 [Dendronephthya gigantea]XP_028411889.1 uncharacterized protein LOC114534621 [Dendronephthya gigantea]XP_028411890.1 uncharacterized protein LOC114534621 [Dendronephthya gigantea]
MSWTSWAHTGAMTAAKAALSIWNPAFPIGISVAEILHSAFYRGDYHGAAIEGVFTIVDAFTFGMAGTATQASRESCKLAIIQKAKEQAKAATKKEIKAVFKAGPSQAVINTAKTLVSETTSDIKKKEGRKLAKNIAKNGLTGTAKETAVKEAKQVTKKLTKEAKKEIGQNLGKEFAKEGIKKATKETGKKVGKAFGMIIKDLPQQTIDEIFKGSSKLTAASVVKEGLMGTASLTGARKKVFENLVDTSTKNFIQKALPKAAKTAFDPEFKKVATKAVTEEFTKFSNNRLGVEILRTGVVGAVNLYRDKGQVL